MEAIDITTPVGRVPLRRLILDWAGEYISVTVGNDVTEKTVKYTGPLAVSLMKGLNTADGKAKSLHRRVLERLVADGHLSGPVIGTPDI